MLTSRHLKSRTSQRAPRRIRWTVTRGTSQEWTSSQCRSSTVRRYWCCTPTYTPVYFHATELSYCWLFFSCWLCFKTYYFLITPLTPSDEMPRRGSHSFYLCLSQFTQDLMEFLNANSTECSVVLFFTAWCQFSARLAPHFNALPRVFPSMHFLALDASQHSRWMAMFSGSVV